MSPGKLGAFISTEIKIINSLHSLSILLCLWQMDSDKVVNMLGLWTASLTGEKCNTSMLFNHVLLLQVFEWRWWVIYRMSANKGTRFQNSLLIPTLYRWLERVESKSQISPSREAAHAEKNISELSCLGAKNMPWMLWTHKHNKTSLYDAQGCYTRVVWCNELQLSGFVQTKDISPREREAHLAHHYSHGESGIPGW